MISHFLRTRSIRTSVILFGALVLCCSVTILGQRKKPTAKPAASVPASSGKCTGSSLTTDEVNQALAIHNFDRAAYKVAPVKWDCKLAAMAQEWATRGVFEHRDTPYGENLFVGADPGATINNMIDMWLSEKAFWTNKTGTCAAGKVCGHFTQIVWKGTTKVGCGVNRNAPGKWKVMFVCNYDPSGNTGGPAF